MPERGGAKALKVLVSGVCIAGAGFIGWVILPDGLVRPSKEASPEAYEAVGKILAGNDSDRCPALRMEASKALNDSLLTISEVASLERHAEEYSDAYDAAVAKNSALEAAGQEPTATAPECPYGSLVFSRY